MKKILEKLVELGVRKDYRGSDYDCVVVYSPAGSDNDTDQAATDQRDPVPVNETDQEPIDDRDDDQSDYENPFFVIDTNQAPTDQREFARYVRTTAGLIMIEVRRDVVVNDEFEVEVRGNQADKYVKTAKRLGRKAKAQDDSLSKQSIENFNQLVDAFDPDYPDSFEHRYPQRGCFKRLADMLTFGSIGYFLSPENHTFGVCLGGGIGYVYDEALSVFNIIFDLSKSVFKYYKTKFELRRRCPLAKRAEDYSRFGETIEDGYVRL